MIYLYTRSEHYKKFISENKSDRIDKGLKITTISNNYSNLLKLSNNIINEEIFDNPIECEYTLFTINDNHIKIIFTSSSNTTYRLDIYKILENNELINHISFTVNNDLFDRIPKNQMEQDEYDIEYEKITNKKEIYNVLGKIRYILNDVINKNIINNKFCIGGTELSKKNSLYEYFLKVVIGDNGFQKRQTNIYPKIGWGLYFEV